MQISGLSLKEAWRTCRPHQLAALVAVLSSVLMTWPLAQSAGQSILRAIYYWDAYTNAMIMGSRVDAALGLGPLGLHDDYYFAPLPRSIVFNENHFGLSLIFAPFYLLTQHPLWAYNMTLLSSLALSVFFMYLLVRHLTGNRYVGIIVGVAYAYSPFVAFEMGRIQLMAVQWIPAIFLFLDRAIQDQKRRDIFAFWVFILLQIGTCLYYTMFMIPLVGLAIAMLVARHRPRAKFYFWFGATGVVAGAIALFLVYPYFAVRESFNLERTLAIASANDGKFSFFGNVHPTNRSLTGMHHLVGARGAHDEIAFPGFTVLFFVLLALYAPLKPFLGPLFWVRMRGSVLKWLLLGFLALAGTLFTRNMLTGVLVFGLGSVVLVRRRILHPFQGPNGLYLALLLVALAMFLGIYPLEWQGSKVHGLYYYFHTYFPGFNGIRKVGRQAVMTTFVLCVLAGFGGSWFFSRFRQRSTQVAWLAAFLSVLSFELRCYPHPLEPVFGADPVPPVLAFVSSLPKDDLIAIVPQDTGKKVFRGDAGMALHNLHALHHKHRFVHGQSSWQPPVTELARRAVAQLPQEGARRTLLSLGAKHLVVFGEDLGSSQRDLKARLESRPEEYQLLFASGSDAVFTLVRKDEDAVDLVPTPALPPNAQKISQTELVGSASLRSEYAKLAVDGDINTYWTGRRFQEPGQYFDVKLRSPRKVSVLEIEALARVTDVPVAFRLSASSGGKDLGILAEAPHLRLYEDQIFSPRRFVFRVVLPLPTELDELRITILEPVPGSYFSIHELSLYEVK
jgi:hypothetical protein